IGVLEALVAPHRFAALQFQRLGKQRPGMTERVELPVFAAEVDIVRQVFKEGGIEFTPAETGVQLSGVDANDMRTMAIRPELSRQCRGVAAPQRKQGFPVGVLEPGFAILANILEKNVAERAIPD